MPSLFTVRNAGDAAAPAEILIYEMIGKDWWDGSGVIAKDFAENLKKIPATQDIIVSINSPGGNVWDGLAIYHQLKMRGQKVTTRIDGVAASIASVIAMAGHKIIMPKNAMMMIHDPSGMASGNAEDFRKYANELERVGSNIADIYASRSGRSKQEFIDKMKKETWLDGQDALNLGLATEMEADLKVAAHFDFSVFSALGFKNIPEKLKTTATETANSGAVKNTENNNMNKSAILALLKSHGVNLADTATEDSILAELAKLVTAGKVTKDEQNKLTTPVAAPAPAPAPQNVVPISREEFANVTNQLAQERNARITAEFDRLCMTNANIDRTLWLPRVLADQTLLTDLAKLPNAASDPFRPMASDLGNSLAEKYKKMKPGIERNMFRLENHDALGRLSHAIMDQGDLNRLRRTFDPQDANTLGASLVTDYLSDGLLIVAANKLAPLALFSRKFSADPQKPRATIQVPKATAGATSQTNATNFESGDTTLTNVPVTVNQISQSFHLTNDQLNKGFDLAQLAGINADVFANALSDIWTAIDIVGNYGAAQVIGLAANFDPNDLPALFGVAKNFRLRNLLLDGTYLAFLFPGVISNFSSGVGLGAGNQSRTVFPGVFGFDNIAMQNRWTAATANSVGFLCGPDALAIAAAMPIQQPASEFISMKTITIEGAGTNDSSLGISVQLVTWYSRATRTIWASYDVMFGAAAGEVTQGKGLVSA